jgi:hypothetical protein
MNMKSLVRTAIVLLLAGSPGWAQMPAKSGAAASQPLASQGAPAAASDAALNELLTQLETSARQSDQDLAGLHIQKWKADAASRQEAENNAAAIRRNLANAVPQLLQEVRSAPGSLAANFKLYRDLNALYDTFSSLVESAGAFGPAEQYSPLASDIVRLDQLRHKFAERLDQMTAARDAEVIRLRAQLAATTASARTAPPVTKIVVDDNHPHPAAHPAKKKKKTTSPPPPPKP